MGGRRVGQCGGYAVGKLECIKSHIDTFNGIFAVEELVSAAGCSSPTLFILRLVSILKQGVANDQVE